MGSLRTVLDHPSAAAGAAAGARLETPTIDFGPIPDGCSVARPVVVSADRGRRLDLRVVVPPLAPFSISESPTGHRAREGAEADANGRATVWVRYDSVRPMGRFAGEMVIEETGTGQRWSVRLSGSEARARR